MKSIFQSISRQSSNGCLVNMADESVVFTVWFHVCVHGFCAMEVHQRDPDDLFRLEREERSNDTQLERTKPRHRRLLGVG